MFPEKIEILPKNEILRKNQTFVLKFLGKKILKQFLKPEFPSEFPQNKIKCLFQSNAK